MLLFSFINLRLVSFLQLFSSTKVKWYIFDSDAISRSDKIHYVYIMFNNNWQRKYESILSQTRGWGLNPLTPDVH